MNHRTPSAVYLLTFLDIPHSGALQDSVDVSSKTFCLTT
jgi:hypothetical protein